jgi:hypothetical protein
LKRSRSISTKKSFAGIVAPFGLRKVAPRACIADKPHLQDFFCEALEEIGFVTCKYDENSSLSD